MCAVFIGNFVNDIIVRWVGEEERISHATGGSVTYGSLAAISFGCDPPPKIISKAGNDLPKQFLDTLRSRHIALDSVQFIDGKNTSYKLHYDRSNHRTLSLKERGFFILAQDIIEKIGKPEAIFFVPVSAEFSEDVVLEVMQHIKNKFGADELYRPIVALDAQGFVRDLAGSRVLTLSHDEMVKKFEKLATLQKYGSITMLKAEHAEAVVVVGNLSPPECAKELRVKYGFSVVSVTMGHLGSYLSSEITGEVYIPAFKANQVLDETGCGDTFLTCSVLELLLHKQNLSKSPGGRAAGGILSQYRKEDLIQAMLVGSAAASFLVEKIGPEGFASRDQILERIKTGERTKEMAEEKGGFSLTVYSPKKK
eukprot:Phypoly_transcript_10929.p1 GENE.Phypoly_transcript_10929~~Phypoly_transcript_10929.p1  ORF type:complete len:367 (+),score=52.14 Phypoly_transcript_10929:101-1201(+)